MTSESVVCEGCGRLATGRRADSKYCSAACRQRSYRGRLEAQVEAIKRELEKAKRADAQAKERADFVASLIG
jgi:outer membrane murein-binding lipoprotein Lpp